MLEDPRRYPLLRGQRRRRLLRRLGRLGWRPSRVAAGAGLALAVMLAVWVVWRATRPDPRAQLIASVRLMDAGAYSAARARAAAAVAADPANGAAHAILARALLLTGDGAAAEGELVSAAAHGFDTARTHQAVAETALLQGDAPRALVEAAHAGPGYHAYAGRIAARAQAVMGNAASARATLNAVIARSPGDGLAWRDLGQVALDAGDVGSAAEAAARAVAIAPGEPGALVLEGEVTHARRGSPAALPWFDAALRRDAGYVPALLDRAAALGEAGRYREMLVATRRALAEHPDQPRALYLEAVLAARAGRNDLARDLLARTHGAIDHWPGVLLLQGSLDYADGRFEQAVLRWRELLGRQPANLVARRLLGAALLRSGDARAAFALLRPVLARGDADSYTTALAARAVEALGDRTTAAALLDRHDGGVDVSSFAVEGGVPAATDAVRSHPGDPARMIDLIRALLSAGRHDVALTDARMLVRAGPGVPAAWIVLGDVLAANGDWHAAADAYAKAADLRFDEPVMLRFVDALARAGERTKAAQVVALYWSRNPQNVAAARLAAALQLDAGDWTEAARTLNQLRALTGARDSALLITLAAAHGGTGERSRARDEARAAYLLTPGSPAAADAYGRALSGAGDRSEAAQLLTKAALLAPPVPTPHARGIGGRRLPAR